MSRNHRAFILLIPLLLASALPSAVVLADENTPLKQVSLRLLWKHQFQFAGYYMAKEKGFYRQRGLDVAIHENTHGVDNLKSVLSGDSDFAVTRSSLLIDRAEGADVVALLAAFQRSPLMLLTKAFTGIQHPADLYNKRIMITSSARMSSELIAMLAKAGVTDDSYTRQQHSFNIEDLIDNHTDAMAAYVSNEPYVLIQRGIPYNILHPADFGFNMYSDILYTSGNLVREQPELVQDFYEASIDGWKYAFANITETIFIIQQKYNTQQRTPEALLYEAHELQRLAFDERKNFGTLSPHRFRAMAQIYLITGALAREPDLSGFVYNPPQDSLNLTYNEVEYLKLKKEIKVCVQKNWQPYEAQDNESYHGIVADYLNLLRDRLGLTIRPVFTDSSEQALTLTSQGVCDVASSADQLSTKPKGLLLTQGHLNIPIVIASDEPISDLDSFPGRIALALNTPYYNSLEAQLDATRTVIVDDAQQGLSKLQNQAVDAVVGSYAHIQYLVNQSGTKDIVFTDLNHLAWKSAFAINRQQPELHGILDKTLDKITQQDRTRIISRWIYSSPVERNDWIYWLIIGVISLLLLAAGYRLLTARIRNRLLQKISETDALTGVGNRRKTLQQIQNFIDMSNRYAHELSIIYFDIDNFKQINDRYGHSTGDRILCELSRLIAAKIRKTDVLGRIGGEEFVIASPETSHQQASHLAEELLHSIHSHDFKLEKPVSCSFGIALLRQGETLDDLLNRADKSMYLAKQQGKDRIDITELNLT